MQLKKQKKIAGLLSAATCSLLATTAQAEEAKWDVDTAVLLYSETDRVTAVEPVISAKKDLGDDEILSMKLVLDTLTGASANGAVPSTSAQTFTGPSGGAAYTVEANETPLDDTFKDTRAAFSINWDKPTARDQRRNLGINVSSEYDFTSAGGNAVWSFDTNQKNTTYTVGGNIELDQINPVGGSPEPLTDFSGTPRVRSDETRTVTDLLVGVTQVIDASSLFQLNLSYSMADGYMTDPYKMVSVVDSSSGEPIRQLSERRPDSRARQSVYGKYKRQLDNHDIVTASYRFMSDDWGVESNTFDFTYRFKMDNGFFVQPHLRLYEQSAADFYNYFLVDGEALPEYASADYRLGEMTTTTVGLKFGQTIDDKHVWSTRFEMYQQSGESSPSEAIGQLKNQDLFPDVEAVIVQFNYSFKF